MQTFASVSRSAARSGPMTPTLRSAGHRQEAQHEQRHGLADPGARVPGGPVRGCRRPGPRPGDADQQGRHQGVADELDHRRDLERAGRVRGAGGDDLAGVVDRGAGPQPEGRVVQAEGVPDGRIGEHGARPEQGHHRDGIGDVAAACPDDRRRGHDRGVAADRGPDREQDGEPRLDVGQPRQAQDQAQGAGHDHGDHQRGGQPDAQDLVDAEPGAQQHDPEAEDPLRRERDPRSERRGPSGRGLRDEDAEQDRDRHLGDRRGEHRR